MYYPDDVEQPLNMDSGSILSYSAANFQVAKLVFGRLIWPDLGGFVTGLAWMAEDKRAVHPSLIFEKLRAERLSNMLRRLPTKSH